MTNKPLRTKADRAQQYKQRLGIFMCLIYATVYTTFVIIAVYDVTLMDTIMPFELNLSVFYGVGLIVFALILAVLYSRLCLTAEKKQGCEIKSEQQQGSAKEVC